MLRSNRFVIIIDHIHIIITTRKMPKQGGVSRCRLRHSAADKSIETVYWVGGSVLRYPFHCVKICIHTSPHPQPTFDSHNNFTHTLSLSLYISFARKIPNSPTCHQKSLKQFGRQTHLFNLTALFFILIKCVIDNIIFQLKKLKNFWVSI